MACYFGPDAVTALHRGREEAHLQFADLRERFIARAFRSERAREYASHGFGRRLGTLIRAIDNVYRSLPPEMENIPEREDVTDATISIHSFVLNTFGCLDNLAWIWVCEKDIRREDGAELDPVAVGLGRGNREVRRSFSEDFRAYLDGHER